VAANRGALGGEQGSGAQTDREILHGLGYAQELNRGMGWFSNFAISFSIISILAGGLTSFWLGMVTGGPIVITLGWIIVGFFVLLVGMSMGEICSSYPTAGGLYYWSAKLARTKGPKWAWFTGWFNLLGQIGVIASVDYALSVFIAYFIRMFDSGFNLTAWTIFGIYIVVLISHGVLNTFGVKLVALLSDISVWWHVVGVGIFFVVLLLIPDNNVGLSHVFDQAPPTISSSGLTGWTGGTFIAIYLFSMGLLLAQYTITGFDASAHVSEETVGANVSAPKAIVRAIYVSAIAALFLNVAMIQALPKAANGGIDGDAYSAIAFGGSGDAFLVNAAPRLIDTALGSAAAKLLVFIAIVAQYFCGMASVTANSRMIFAFSRDGALPGSKLWHRINPRTRTPTNSIWLGVTLSAIVGLLSVYQKAGYSTAFFALTGICVIGLYIAYGIPIYLRLRNPDFQPGPWNLRGYHKLVGWTALIWIGVITVLFFAPLFWPFWPPFGETVIGTGADAVTIFHQNNFNFTGPLILAAAAFFWIYWGVSAKRWFTGPKVQGTREELLAIERELEAAAAGKAAVPAPGVIAPEPG
jgi:amino acid transporter